MALPSVSPKTKSNGNIEKDSMILNLKLSDELYNQYLLQYGSPAHYKRMKEAIEFFVGVPANDRAVILAGKDRQRVEAVFQTTIDDGAKLAKLCEGMSTVSIGGVNVTFSDDQMKRIDMQATFVRMTREAFIRRMVEEIIQKFMEEI